MHPKIAFHKFSLLHTNQLLMKTSENEIQKFIFLSKHYFVIIWRSILTLFFSWIFIIEFKKKISKHNFSIVVSTTFCCCCFLFNENFSKLKFFFPTAVFSRVRKKFSLKKHIQFIFFFCYPWKERQHLGKHRGNNADCNEKCLKVGWGRKINLFLSSFGQRKFMQRKSF